MLTPQEVADHAFAKATFGGYNMAMVDEFLDLLTADYTTLYKDNTALKAKMKVLADKVEEYQATDDAMRKTLMAAQKMADQMVAEAREKADSMLAQAEQEAREKVAGFRRDVENERLRLAAARSETSAYVKQLTELYQHEMDYLGSLSTLTAEPPKTDAVTQAAEEIGDAVAQAVAEEIPEQAPREEPAEAPVPAEAPAEEGNLYKDLTEGKAVDDDEDEDDSPTRRINFDDLKFGRDYEIR